MNRLFWPAVLVLVIAITLLVDTVYAPIPATGADYTAALKNVRPQCAKDFGPNWEQLHPNCASDRMQKWREANCHLFDWYLPACAARAALK